MFNKLRTGKLSPIFGYNPEEEEPLIEERYHLVHEHEYPESFSELLVDISEEEENTISDQENSEECTITLDMIQSIAKNSKVSLIDAEDSNNNFIFKFILSKKLCIFQEFFLLFIQPRNIIQANLKIGTETVSTIPRHALGKNIELCFFKENGIKKIPLPNCCYNGMSIEIITERMPEKKPVLMCAITSVADSEKQLFENTVRIEASTPFDKVSLEWNNGIFEKRLLGNSSKSNSYLFEKTLKFVKNSMYACMKSNQWYSTFDLVLFDVRVIVEFCLRYKLRFRYEERSHQLVVYWK